MNSSSILPKLLIGFLGLLILGYVVFRFYPLLVGPTIKVVTPGEYTLTTLDAIDIVMESKRVTELYIQGLPVDVSASGMTTYTYQLSEGLNRVDIEVYDAYDSKKEYAISVLKK